jgi:hypothetical protein
MEVWCADTVDPDYDIKVTFDIRNFDIKVDLQDRSSKVSDAVVYHIIEVYQRISSGCVHLVIQINLRLQHTDSPQT